MTTDVYSSRAFTAMLRSSFYRYAKTLGAHSLRNRGGVIDVLVGPRMDVILGRGVSVEQAYEDAASNLRTWIDSGDPGASMSPHGLVELEPADIPNIRY
jgi:hypothetical protein